MQLTEINRWTVPLTLIVMQVHKQVFLSKSHLTCTRFCVGAANDRGALGMDLE